MLESKVPLFEAFLLFCECMCVHIVYKTRLLLLYLPSSFTVGKKPCVLILSSAWQTTWCIWSNAAFHFQSHRWQNKFQNAFLQMSERSRKTDRYRFAHVSVSWKIRNNYVENQVTFLILSFLYLIFINNLLNKYYV